MVYFYITLSHPVYYKYNDKTQPQAISYSATEHQQEQQSSEMTLVTCDSLSHQTGPYDIKKNTHRDSRNIHRSWPEDQVSQLVEEDA